MQIQRLPDAYFSGVRWSLEWELALSLALNGALMMSNLLGAWRTRTYTKTGARVNIWWHETKWVWLIINVPLIVGDFLSNWVWIRWTWYAVTDYNRVQCQSKNTFILPVREVTSQRRKRIKKALWRLRVSANVHKVAIYKAWEIVLMDRHHSFIILHLQNSLNIQANCTFY